MAFEGVNIRSVKTPPGGGGGTQIGWRQDLNAGDVLVLSLTSTVGVSSYRWLLVGRPEGSNAGGAGPEPVLLGTGATASFTVDSDPGGGSLPTDGTYIIHCVVNGGSPTETVITVGMARLNAATIDGLALRFLGGFEVFEDTSDPNVKQGWTTMLNRLLRRAIQGSSSADAAVPAALRQKNEWYVWGRRLSDSSGGDTGGLSLTNTSPQGVMISIPEFFPRAGTITALAMVLNPDSATANKNWLGIAPNVWSSGIPYPGVTGASTDVVGTGLSGNRIRGGAVSYPVAQGSILWGLHQTSRTFADGAFCVGIDKSSLNNMLGYSGESGNLIEGLTFGDAFPNTFNFYGFVGYEASVANGTSSPAYVLGQNFPAGQNKLRASNSTAWATTSVPMILYQFTPS